MQYAQVVVIEADGESVTLKLKGTLTIHEIHEIFRSKLLLYCEVSISAGVARVNVDTRKAQKGDFIGNAKLGTV